MSASLAILVEAGATAAALASLERAAPAQQAAALLAAAPDALRLAREETPLGRGESPGRLRAGWDSALAVTAAGAELELTNAVPYAPIVRDGRRAIVARPGGVLRFVIGGRVLFRRSVGPAVANDYEGRARDAIERRLAGPVAADAAERIGRVAG